MMAGGEDGHIAGAHRTIGIKTETDRPGWWSQTRDMTSLHCAVLWRPEQLSGGSTLRRMDGITIPGKDWEATVFCFGQKSRRTIALSSEKRFSLRARSVDFWAVWRARRTDLEGRLSPVAVIVVRFVGCHAGDQGMDDGVAFETCALKSSNRLLSGPVLSICRAHVR